MAELAEAVLSQLPDIERTTPSSRGLALYLDQGDEAGTTIFKASKNDHARRYERETDNALRYQFERLKIALRIPTEVAQHSNLKVRTVPI